MIVIKRDGTKVPFNKQKVIDAVNKALFEVEEIDNKGLIDMYFDCDSMSIVTKITKESGFVVPSLEGDGRASYNNINDDGEMILIGKVNYEKILYRLESASYPESLPDIETDATKIRLQAKYTIDSECFSGNIVSIENNVSSNKFNIYIPDYIVKDNNILFDEVIII